MIQLFSPSDPLKGIPPQDLRGGLLDPGDEHFGYAWTMNVCVKYANTVDMAVQDESHRQVYGYSALANSSLTTDYGNLVLYSADGGVSRSCSRICLF